jgi:phosphoglycolate phosphatase
MKLVLFDIDGTLVRTGGAGMKAFAQAFETEFGISDGSEKLKFAGRTDFSLVREFFNHNGIEASQQNFDRFFATYTRLLSEIILGCEGEVCAGVHDVIQQLRNFEKPPLLGLLTGNIRRGAEIKLRHFDLWEEFEFGGFADDHEDRDCIAAAARQRGSQILGNGLMDGEVLVIGDTPLDIRCARAIRAKVLAVATGGSTAEELRTYAPDWVAEDLSKINLKEVCRC